MTKDHLQDSQPLLHDRKFQQLSPSHFVEPTREEDKREAKKHLACIRIWKLTRRGAATPDRSWRKLPMTEDVGEQSLMAYAPGGIYIEMLLFLLLLL